MATMGPIGEFLLADHARLEELLARSVSGEKIDAAIFEEFRAGLLRHIGIEEKILLPAAKQRRGGEGLPEARRLRIEHSALASLLVPTPTLALAEEIRGLLTRHNPLEEGPDGVYAICDRLLADEAAALVERMRAAPAVPLMRHFDGPGTYRTAEEALRVFERKGEKR